MEVVYSTETSAVTRQAAQAVVDFLNQYKGKPILLLLSAGSSFGLLEHIDGELINSDVTIAVTDERYSEDPAINNFAQLTETKFYKQAADSGAVMIDTRVQKGETLEQLAQRFEAALRDWKTKFPNAAIIATMGMGPDGHTAGIMPYPENSASFMRLFEDVKHWAVGYNATGKHEYPLRVTTTMPFLRLIDHSVAYIVGEAKRSVLQRVLAEQGSLAKTPARILREMKGCKIFTDISI